MQSHLARLVRGPFLPLGRAPSYGSATTYASIHLSTGLWVVSGVWLLRVKLLVVLPASLGEQPSQTRETPNPRNQSTREEKAGSTGCPSPAGIPAASGQGAEINTGSLGMPHGPREPRSLVTAAGYGKGRLQEPPSRGAENTGSPSDVCHLPVQATGDPVLSQAVWSTTAPAPSVSREPKPGRQPRSDPPASSQAPTVFRRDSFFLART